MLLGAITLTSSLPTWAVSPTDTLRSLTTPSNGARTSVRRSCWRAVAARDRAATRSLWPLLRRTSASSSACSEVMPCSCKVLSRCTWRSAWSTDCWAARTASSAEVRLSRMALSSSRTSSSPARTASPFSFSTCCTSAPTSARKSARRSGCNAPLMTGPVACRRAPTVLKSSGASSSGGKALAPVARAALSDCWACGARASGLPGLPQAVNSKVNTTTKVEQRMDGGPQGVRASRAAGCRSGERAGQFKPGRKVSGLPAWT